MTTKRVLITGGAGFIGSALSTRLSSKGYQIRVLDDFSRSGVGGIDVSSEHIEIVSGDIRTPAICDMATSNVDIVFHLASINGTKTFYSDPTAVLDVGARGIINIIDSCIKNNVKELLVASSSEVYQTPPTFPTGEAVGLSIPDPLNPRSSYAGVKIFTELMTINYGRQHFQRAIIFRPHNVFGKSMGWDHVIPELIRKICDSKVFSSANHTSLEIQGSGDETRAFVFIDDFIDGLELLLERGEHMNIYNIGSREEISIAQLADKIAKILGVKVKLKHGDLVDGSPKRRVPDISKLSALGYSPRWALDESLAVVCDWYEAQVNQN